jgi:hypothetical protein
MSWPGNSDEGFGAFQQGMASQREDDGVVVLLDTDPQQE